MRAAAGSPLCPATAGVLPLAPPPAVSPAFLSPRPLAAWVFFSALDQCCTQASQLTQCPDGCGRRIWGASRGACLHLSSIHCNGFCPFSGVYAPEVLWLCRALRQLRALSAFVCPSRLLQTPLKLPIEPKVTPGLIAGSWRPWAAAPQRSCGVLGSGGEAAPAQLSSHARCWDSLRESPAHPAAWLPSASSFVTL